MLQTTINITGNTKNVDGHAVVVADKAGTYYVEGICQWNNDWLERKIRIIGDLVFTRNSKRKIIKKPVIQLL